MSPTRSTLLLGALALASAAAAQDRGKLLGIKAAGDAKASVVLISADRPLSFTTMKLSDPPRVVVDFADTEIAFAHPELTIEDGTVRRVAVAPAGSRTARVVVELQADAEFDVRTARNQVQLRIARPPAVASAEKGPAGPSEEVAAAHNPSPSPPEQQVATAPKEPPPTSQEAAAPPKPPAPAPPQAEPPPSAQAPEPQPQTKPAPARTAPAEAAKTAPAETAKTAPAETAKTAPAETARTAPAEAAKTSPTESTKTSPAEAAKIASLPKVSLVGSAPAASPPARKSPRSPHANITGLGFRPVGAGEVIVRSDHPLAYGVTADSKAVLLHLPGARIPLPNNRRPLDTRFFDGAVQRVVPLVVAGGTDVRIELRQAAEYHLEQSGRVLTVTFSSPR